MSAIKFGRRCGHRWWLGRSEQPGSSTAKRDVLNDEERSWHASPVQYAHARIDALQQEVAFCLSLVGGVGREELLAGFREADELVREKLGIKD